MALPPRVKSYMEDRGVSYETVAHDPTGDSLHTAQAAHVAGRRLAKAVLLEDDRGYVMAVLPAPDRLHLGQMHRQTDRRLGLATEAELADLFPDCTLGAVPALGPAYGLETLVDESLLGVPEVWFEAGDHTTLVRVSGAAFRTLMEQARVAAISEPR